MFSREYDVAHFYLSKFSNSRVASGPEAEGHHGSSEGLHNKMRRNYKKIQKEVIFNKFQSQMPVSER